MFPVADSHRDCDGNTNRCVYHHFRDTRSAIPVTLRTRSCTIILIIALAALAIIPSHALSAPVTTDTSYPGLDAVVIAEMNQTHTSGVVVVIVRNGSIAYARGFGTDTRTGTPMSPDTVLPIGSTTKFFTGYIVASLADEGILDPGAPVRTYIPELDPAFDTVTTEDLITHSAGLSDWDVSGNPMTLSRELMNDPALYVRTFNASSIFTRPGEVMSYSNPGINIAGYAAARAAKSSYGELFRQRITGPLGMNSTGFDDGSDAILPSGSGPASTGKDLARLAIAYMDAGNGSQTLRPGAVRRMTAFTVPEPSNGDNGRYGYGVELTSYGNLTLAGHEGAPFGGTCVFQTDADQRFAVIIIANREMNKFPDTFAWIMNQTFPYTRPVEQVQPVNPEDAVRVSGTYRGYAGFPIRIYQTGGNLIANVTWPDWVVGLPGNGNVTIMNVINSTGSGEYTMRSARGGPPAPVGFVNGPDGSVKYFHSDTHAWPVIEHGSGTAQTPSPVPDETGYPGLDAVVTAEMNQTHTAGVVVVIVRNGSVAYARGFGTDTRTGTPMSPDTVLPIGSTTKFFTGYIVASLAEEGVLDPNVSVRTYIPELDPAFDNVTTAELETHTAGLGDYDLTGLPATPEEWENPVLYFRTINASAFFARPGEVIHYSNPGIDIAGYAAARAANSSYRDLVRQRITGPLGMDSTGFGNDSSVTVYPAGEITSTGNDMGRLAVAYMDAGTGNRTLRPNAARRMTGSSVPDPSGGVNGRYGYGVELSSYGNLTLAGHEGSPEGGTSVFTMVPAQRFAIIIINNRDEATFPETVAWTLNRTFPAVTPYTYVLSPVQPEDAAHVAGTYQGFWDYPIRISRDGGNLAVNVTFSNAIFGLPGNGTVSTHYFINRTTNGGYTIRPIAGGRTSPVGFVNGPDGSVKYFCFSERAFPLVEHDSGPVQVVAPGTLKMPQVSNSIQTMVSGISPARRQNV